MTHNLLKKHIREKVDISNHLLDTVCSYFELRTVEKGDFVLRQYQICQFEGFVLEGCFKVFTIDKEGKENILYFAAEDWWLMDLDSFSNRRPSDLNIQALETSKILYIKKTDKEYLYEHYPIVEKLFRIISQKAIVAWQRRLIRNHCQTATERYLYFVTTYPNIVSRLTDRQIAAYLGITHEFLSKIKKRQKEKL
ncbi:MAG: Crp/Fnr family transcriptional regulator [Bacteroidota bacterium]